MSQSTPPPGSYTQTSTQISFDQSSSGSGILTAQCQTASGGSASSTLQYDVANMNGVLTPLPSGSYQRTSRSIQLVNGSDGVYLVAQCQKNDGTWVQSQLKLQDIANCNGTLKYGSC